MKTLFDETRPETEPRQPDQPEINPAQSPHIDIPMPIAPTPIPGTPGPVPVKS